jgi:SAM-dependent methyltransferase
MCRVSAVGDKLASSVASRGLAVRMFTGMLATQELLATYLGVKLGLYEDLMASGPATVAELSARSGVAERYLREWLEQQAVAGLVAVDDPRRAAEERLYSLPAEHAVVLTASEDPLSLVGLTVLPVGGIAAALPSLLAAYRSGDGVPDEVFGEDWRHGHSGANRALFAHSLPDWIRTCLRTTHERLLRGGRVVDVACGAGFASVALARTYPAIEVDGLDLDAATIELARDHAAAAGVDDRVRFRAIDAADGELAGEYDLVCLFDALHEIARPVEVLQTCRRLAGPDAAVLVMDAKVAPSFRAPADEIERFQYATSVLHCLPACLCGDDSAATGTVMRVPTVRRYAQAAGFTDVRVVPVEDRFHRLYQLRG